VGIATELYLPCIGGRPARVKIMSNDWALMRVISTGHRSSLSALGTGVGRAKPVPTIKCSTTVWGQVSPLGQGFILQRLSHEHSNKTTSPRHLQGKKLEYSDVLLLYASKLHRTYLSRNMLRAGRRFWERILRDQQHVTRHCAGVGSQ
jgi:hypothetical protein